MRRTLGAKGLESGAAAAFVLTALLRRAEPVALAVCCCLWTFLPKVSMTIRLI